MSIRRKFQKSLRTRGLAGTCLLALSWPFQALAEYRGTRRRNEIQAQFDRRYGTDTGGVIALSACTINNPIWIHGVRYGPTPPERFRECLSLLPLKPHEYARHAYVDLGSGKGATLLYACDLGFQTVLGVELVEEFHRIAERNIQLYPSARSAARSICCDATTFPFPAGPVIVFACNPFSEHVMNLVLPNMLPSVPGEMYLVYEHCHYALDSLPHGNRLRLIAEKGLCRAYAVMPAGHPNGSTS